MHKDIFPVWPILHTLWLWIPVSLHWLPPSYWFEYLRITLIGVSMPYISISISYLICSVFVVWWGALGFTGLNVKKGGSVVESWQPFTLQGTLWGKVWKSQRSCECVCPSFPGDWMLCRDHLSVHTSTTFPHFIFSPSSSCRPVSPTPCFIVFKCVCHYSVLTPALRHDPQQMYHRHGYHNICVLFRFLKILILILLQFDWSNFKLHVSVMYTGTVPFFSFSSLPPLLLCVSHYSVFLMPLLHLFSSLLPSFSFPPPPSISLLTLIAAAALSGRTSLR